jgi:hypothetical protein
MLSELDCSSLKEFPPATGQRLAARFADQQMHMLGHDNVAVDAQRVASTHPLQSGFEERARLSGKCPEQWQWSSYNHYPTGSLGQVEIESEWTANQRERDAGTRCETIKLPHSSK